MHVSAKADYAVRALVELTALTADQPGNVTVEQMCRRQGLPVKFLETIFTELRKDGLVVSRRGVDGGYRLARDPASISVADIIRGVDGPLAAVRGLRPEDTDYDGAATHLPRVWVALRAAVAARQGEEINTAVQRYNPAIEQLVGPHALPSKVIDDEDAIVGFHLQRSGVELRDRIELQFQHLNRQLATNEYRWPIAEHPARIVALRVRLIGGNVHVGIVNSDDLSIDVHRVRHPDTVKRHDVGKCARNGRLAGAAGTVEENRSTGVKRGAQLLQSGRLQHQM